jgi:hypothetical protein
MLTHLAQQREYKFNLRCSKFTLFFFKLFKNISPTFFNKKIEEEEKYLKYLKENPPY